MSIEVPKIQPHKLKEYTTKQSRYPMVGRLPTRSILVGPSGSGKGILLSNMILDIYRDCFSRIYIFSPSINVDHTWEPVKDYIQKQMKVENTDEDPIYFSEPNMSALENIIETQHQIIKYMKTQEHTKLYQILIIIDDFADDEKFSRHSKLLNQLYVRGRHNMISTITSTQKFRAIGNIIRINITELYVFRLRNLHDLEAFIEEVSALADKKSLMQIYNLATEDPYSFLYVKLNSKSKKDMFYINYDKRIELEN
mgnify:FL=1|tara:strand:- start:2065 stop:2826 length:762 start_codon:yes stop_codon:yes gene_type:complete